MVEGVGNHTQREWSVPALTGESQICVRIQKVWFPGPPFCWKFSGGRRCSARHEAADCHLYVRSPLFALWMCRLYVACSCAGIALVCVFCSPLLSSFRVGVAYRLCGEEGDGGGSLLTLPHIKRDRQFKLNCSWWTSTLECCGMF